MHYITASLYVLCLGVSPYLSILDFDRSVCLFEFLFCVLVSLCTFKIISYPQIVVHILYACLFMEVVVKGTVFAPSSRVQKIPLVSISSVIRRKQPHITIKGQNYSGRHEADLCPKVSNITFFLLHSPSLF